MLGGFINNWLISGITNIQSGPNMQTGVSASPGYYLQGNIGQGANQYPRRIAVDPRHARTSTCSRCSSAIRGRVSARISTSTRMLRPARTRNQWPVH